MSVDDVNRKNFNMEGSFLCWGTFATGVIALIINFILFYVLLRLENKFGDGQVKRHYHNKIIAVFIGCILNLAIIGAFSGISTLLVRFAGKVKTGSGARYARYAACAMSAGAAIMTLITIVADVVKLCSHDAEKQRNFDHGMAETDRSRIAHA